MIEEIEREGLTLMHLRIVPTNPACLGKDARATEPDIKPVFITGVKMCIRDRLLCFPEPLTPLKGFSCSNRRKPWLRATLRMSDMRSML